MTVWLNDLDPRSWGVSFGAATPLAGAPLARPGRVELPGLIGAVDVDPGTTVEAARWTTPVSVLRDARPAWRRLIAGTFGYVTWRHVSDLTLERRVRLVELTVSSAPPGGGAPQVGVATWEAVDPTWAAVEPTLLPLAAGVDAWAANGTAPALGVWTVAGPATNPAIVVAGVSATLAVTLGAADWLELDGEAGTVTGVVGGAAVEDGRPYLAVGSTIPVIPPGGAVVRTVGARGTLALRRAEVI